MTWFQSTLCVSLLSGFVLGQQVTKQPEPPSTDPVELLSSYLQLKTVNPPGNEILGAQFIGSVLERHSVSYRILQSEPGRANLIARIEGSGEKGSLVLLHHIDVVPADEGLWQLNPFSGAIRDGYVWGRGALDTKSLGISQLVAFLALKATGRTPVRDVLLVATADEEAGGHLGAGWLVDNHFELFSEAELVLTEGGINIPGQDGLAYVGIEVTQKIPFWLRLTAVGQPGHGSTPADDSAVLRLVRAIERVIKIEPYRRLIDPVEKYLREIAPFRPDQLKPLLEDPARTFKDPARFRKLDPFYRALLQDTIAVTLLEAGQKTNVIPAEASAELDCRLLPDRDPEEFLQEIVDAIADPHVRVETMLSFEPSFSKFPDDLKRLLEEILARGQSLPKIGPAVLPGFTDSHFFRERGISAFGFSPFQMESAEAAGIHGKDERISLEAFQRGVEVYAELVARLAGVQ